MANLVPPTIHLPRLMTHTTSNSKRKRDSSPEYTSKGSQKRPKGLKGFQQSLGTTSSSSRDAEWMSLVTSVDEIGQIHADTACSIGQLGRRDVCPNKYSATMDHVPKMTLQEDKEVINITDSEDEYVAPKCVKARCKASPYCLNFLGQEEWENPGSRCWSA